MYRPTTSRTLSISSGSFESWKPSVRCGLSPNDCQMRWMLSWLSPTALAICRVLQCVAPFGVDSNVLTTTASTCSSLIARGAPGRGSSSNPSRRASTNRARHLPTVCAVVRSRRDTLVLSSPSAHNSTICARIDSLCAVVPRRT